ncbi:MAG TPA: hypothetical protein VJU15_14480 [Gemmatimonadales bacterium]|nr:hypothetical protein [Gemmatimonadales bacterium]
MHELRPSRSVARRMACAGAFFLAACGDGGSEPPPEGGANCDNPADVTLAVGQHVVADPAASTGCVTIVAQAGTEREFLISLSSGAGAVTTTGVSGPYAIRIAPHSATASAPATPQAAPRLNPRTEAVPAAFHAMLREREHALSLQPGNRVFAPPSPPQAIPPIVGSEATFNVCRTTQCNTFDQVTATVKSVGTKVAIYQDNTVPATDPLQQADFDDLTRTFDTYHHPIDVAAFGNESDLDANGVVIILLTDAVNALTPDCTNGRILGYFYGGDLLDITGSNHAEIFYAMVPAPNSGSCTGATRENTVDRLKPTLIHEFQHMISFNQHALVRGGQSEVTWLNEGLSHFAEELGGTKIPASECVGFPGTNPCRSQYTSGDLFNAYDYLSDTEAHFLVSPNGPGSTGTLEERGAGWLFVRWLADQFGTDADGSNVTKALVGTQQQGAGNVSAVTGQPFETLIGEWQLAVYLDDLPGFTPLSNRLRYASWGFRATFANNCCGADKPFDRPFPFTPTDASNMPFAQPGTLRGGSGTHFSLILPANAPAVDILVARQAGGAELDPTLDARISIARIR